MGGDRRQDLIRPRNTCTTTANCAQITLKIACFITTHEIA